MRYYLDMEGFTSRDTRAVTAKEATALLPGMTYARLMRLAKRGDIPSIQYGAGSRRFFLLSDLMEYARASGVEMGDHSAHLHDVPIPGLGRAGR